MQSCRLCNRPTEIVVNIDFKAVPLCDYCCLAVAKQTVTALSVEQWKSLATGLVTTEIRSKREGA